jgi:low affinity Fe/Cu permease
MMFEKFVNLVVKWTGSVYAFLLALLVIFIWALFGPICHYSDFWQLTINTGTTIITFLMVFIIQQSTNKEQLAIQIKLNELIAASSASNQLINIENLTEEQVKDLHERYNALRGPGKDQRSINQINS